MFVTSIATLSQWKYCIHIHNLRKVQISIQWFEVGERGGGGKNTASWNDPNSTKGKFHFLEYLSNESGRGRYDHFVPSPNNFWLGGKTITPWFVPLVKYNKVSHTVSGWDFSQLPLPLTVLSNKQPKPNIHLNYCKFDSLQVHSFSFNMHFMITFKKVT